MSKADIIHVAASPELRELRALEVIIEQTQDAAEANIEAWKTILDKELWRAAGYKNKIEYLKKRWGKEKSQVYHNLKMGEVASQIKMDCDSEISESLKQSHLAELAPYEPSKRKEILEVALKTAPGGKLTAGWIEQTARRLNEAELAAAKEAREQQRRAAAEEEEEDEDDENEPEEEEEPEEEKPQKEVSEESQAILDAAKHDVTTAPDKAKLHEQAKRSVAKLQRIALALGCTVEYLVGLYRAG